MASVLDTELKALNIGNSDIDERAEPHPNVAPDPHGTL